MTRINCIHPKELTDQHLLAEIREITRLPNNLYKSLNRKSGPLRQEEIPPEYVLGKGHVKFFYDKFKWLKDRFEALVEEAEKREFKLTYKDSDIFSKVPNRYYGNWKVNKKAQNLSRQRILERIKAKPNYYRHYGVKIDEKSR